MNFMDQLDPELRVVLEAFPTRGGGPEQHSGSPREDEKADH